MPVLIRLSVSTGDVFTFNIRYAVGLGAAARPNVVVPLLAACACAARIFICMTTAHQSGYRKTHPNFFHSLGISPSQRGGAIAGLTCSFQNDHPTRNGAIWAFRC